MIQTEITIGSTRYRLAEAPEIGRVAARAIVQRIAADVVPLELPAGVFIDLARHLLAGSLEVEVEDRESATWAPLDRVGHLPLTLDGGRVVSRLLEEAIALNGLEPAQGSKENHA